MLQHTQFIFFLCFSVCISVHTRQVCVYLLVFVVVVVIFTYLPYSTSFFLLDFEMSLLLLLNKGGWNSSLVVCVELHVWLDATLWA